MTLRFNSQTHKYTEFHYLIAKIYFYFNILETFTRFFWRKSDMKEKIIQNSCRSSFYRL